MKWATVAMLALAAHCAREARDAQAPPDAAPPPGPPTLGELLESPAALAVLPSAEAPEMQELYRRLVESRQGHEDAVEVVSDAELSAIPTGRPVWVLGAVNRFVPKLFGPGRVRGLIVALGRIGLDNQVVPSANHSLAVVRRHPEGSEAVAWIVVDPPAAAPRVGEQLPALADSSYAAFEGPGAEQVLAGVWGEASSRAAETAAPTPRPAPPPTARRPPIDLGTQPKLGFQTGDGVALAGVKPGSPAAAAGLAAGDVLTRVNGRWVHDLRGYVALLRTLELGDAVTFTVRRAGEELELSAPIGD